MIMKGKDQAGYGQGEQMAHLPNNSFGNCTIWCFHQSPSGKCNTSQMAPRKSRVWRGYLQSDKWRHRGTQTMATDEAVTFPGRKGQGEEWVWPGPRWRMESQQQTATARNTMLKQETARKTILSLLLSAGLLLVPPTGQTQWGKVALVVWPAVESLQVQNMTAKARNGSGAGEGARGNGTNRRTRTYGYVQAFSRTFCLQGWESLFIRMKPLVNMPPSDAHIKYWCKNGSGLNTHQCFLMC